MDNTISIDFGTTRTKLAHFSLLTKKPELMRFQKDDPFIPSLFYLFRDNDQILFGHDAEEMLEEDPAGIIAVLKRHLKDTYVRANRKRKSPGEMLLFLFTKLRELAGKEIPAFEGNPPRKVILTIPVLYGPPEERLLRDAASHAGFEEVELLPEPVAAARAWLAETGERSKEVIVFDCGGGTIDWAYLRRENGDFRVIPDCPPGGDRCVGGHDIDNELLDLLKDKLPEELHGEIEEKAPYYLQQVRTVKERYCRGRSVRPLRIGSTQVALHEDQMRSVFENRFISQSCEHLKIYIERVRKISSGEIPMVLLVGAVQGLRGLSEAIESRCSCKTSWWERSEYTTVLGLCLKVWKRQDGRISGKNGKR